jgi:hypothetical protein
MQRGATTPSRPQGGGCGGSLEDELCPDEIEGWTSCCILTVRRREHIEILDFH